MGLLLGLRSTDRQNAKFAENERRWRMCRKKRRYIDWARAEAVALMLSERGLALAYRCPFCALWHVGHPPRVAFASINDASRARWQG